MPQGPVALQSLHMIPFSIKQRKSYSLALQYKAVRILVLLPHKNNLDCNCIKHFNIVIMAKNDFGGRFLSFLDLSHNIALIKLFSCTEYKATLIVNYNYQCSL